MLKLTSPVFLAPRERTAQQWADHHRKVVLILIVLGAIASYPMGVFVMAVLTAPMKSPPAAPAVRPIRASGVVVSMNDTLGSIAVQHLGVPELNLPAGTTSFRADPSVFKRTEVGDRITFDLTREAGVYAITASQPSPEP
jgi:Cu/Ag efflux protein CusF